MGEYTINAEERLDRPGERMSYESNHGFTVSWFDLVDTTTVEPGIRISLCQPDGTIKNDDRFTFEEEEKAKEAFKGYVKQVDEWDKIEI
jgi:hypothetical protein